MIADHSRMPRVNEALYGDNMERTILLKPVSNGDSHGEDNLSLDKLPKEKIFVVLVSSDNYYAPKQVRPNKLKGLLSTIANASKQGAKFAATNQSLGNAAFLATTGVLGLTAAIIRNENPTLSMALGIGAGCSGIGMAGWNVYAWTGSRLNRKNEGSNSKHGLGSEDV